MKEKTKRKLFNTTLCIVLALSLCGYLSVRKNTDLDTVADNSGYIKWVDFNVSSVAMNEAMKVDIDTYGTDLHISWIDILSYLGARYGGSFKAYKKSDLDYFVNAVKNGKSIDEFSSEMKYFSYFREAYTAVLGGYVGEYYKGGMKYYGLRVFSPIASGYQYSHYDDFCSPRSYGYKRNHLGHDLMGSIGTPIIAIESGYVEVLGWNQYGGWRIGIRSFDNKRYYYYAHLRKDHPYSDIKEGDVITAGDVIGYLGMTGYSTKENVNNINVPHLHFGIQLIFDSSQKDGANQIWIDCYEITKFLSKNKMKVQMDKDSGEFESIDDIIIYDIPD